MRNGRQTIVVLGISGMLFIALCFFSFYMAVKPVPSRNQLCRHLSEFIERTKCRDLENTLDVLNAAFPTHEATREEVKNALDMYSYDSFESEFVIRDSYNLDKRWITNNLPFFVYQPYIFHFDKDGVLFKIEFYDF